VLNRVVPYSDQQVSGTYGGPIVKDKLHFFANYEYERQPNTIISNQPYPVFNIPDTHATTRNNYYGGRVDWVITPSTHLMARGSGFTFNVPAQGTPTTHPSTWGNNDEKSGQAFVSLTHTSMSHVNELKVGFSGFTDTLGRLVPGVVPAVTLAGGYVIGRTLAALAGGQKTPSVRDDFTLFRGKHELKMGADFFYPSSRLYYGNNPDGSLDATLGPV